MKTLPTLALAFILPVSAAQANNDKQALMNLGDADQAVKADSVTSDGQGGLTITFSTTDVAVKVPALTGLLSKPGAKIAIFDPAKVDPKTNPECLVISAPGKDKRNLHMGWLSHTLTVKLSPEEVAQIEKSGCAVTGIPEDLRSAPALVK